MSVNVKVDSSEVRAGLGELRLGVADKASLLRICLVLMQASISRTFREEGSPAGSWPRLAASTLLRKGYTSGHKLLILSGRLFRSINGVIQGDTLIIGSSLVYAPVHQFGSKGWMGGAAGPRTAEQMAHVGKHDASRSQFKRYGRGKDAAGRTRTLRFKGPAPMTRFSVGDHLRRQNIPARPYLVFRPEDPLRLQTAIERYLAGKAMRIGVVTTSAPAGGAA